MNSMGWIALGGALGAVLRYAGVMLASQLLPVAFPFGTLLVNLLGSLAIGSVFGALGGHPQFETFLRPLLVIGILGGFTTFSSFTMEVLLLMQSKQFIHALLYVLASNLLGIGAAWSGYKFFAA